MLKNVIDCLESLTYYLRNHHKLINQCQGERSLSRTYSKSECVMERRRWRSCLQKEWFKIDNHFSQL